MFVLFSVFFIVFHCRIINSVPPSACYAKFRWEDCGKPPVPVMYYWRPGSRCEVGLWRGCLPNLNMFQDEYECVATCIYSSRAGPSDFHSLDAVEQIDTTELEILTTPSNGTDEENTTIGYTMQDTGETGHTAEVGKEEGGNETSTNIDAATTVAA